MQSLIWDVVLGAVPFCLLLAFTWRLVWPRWKLAGKVLAYFGAVSLLSAALGHWSLIFAYAHQAFGFAFHLWFCRRHGFTWYRVEDWSRYQQLSKAMVGYRPSQKPAGGTEDAGYHRAPRCEGGPPPAIEWCVSDQNGEPKS